MRVRVAKKDPQQKAQDRAQRAQTKALRAQKRAQEGQLMAQERAQEAGGGAAPALPPPTGVPPVDAPMQGALAAGAPATVAPPASGAAPADDSEATGDAAMVAAAAPAV